MTGTTPACGSSIFRWLPNHLLPTSLGPADHINGRVDLMLLAGSIMLFLAGPARAAIDEVWFER